MLADASQFTDHQILLPDLSRYKILSVVFRVDAFFGIPLFAVGIHPGTDIVHPVFVHHFPEFGIGVRQGFPETDRFHGV